MPVIGKLFMVKFALENGHTINVAPISEQQARNYLRDWLSGKMAPLIGDETCSYPWALQSSRIISIHLYPVDERGNILDETGKPVPQQQQIRSPFAPPGPGASGYLR